MSKKWLLITFCYFPKNVICRHATHFDQMGHIYCLKVTLFLRNYSATIISLSKSANSSIHNTAYDVPRLLFPPILKQQCIHTRCTTHPRTGKTSPSLPFLHMATCMCACMCAYVHVCVLACVLV